jgi:hypothetical protein
MKNTSEKTYTYKISGLPSNELVYSNNVFLNPEDYKKVQLETGAGDKIYFSIKGFLFSVQQCNDVVKSYLSLSKISRDIVQIPGTGEVSVSCKIIFDISLGIYDQT